MGVSARDTNKFYVGLGGGYTYDIIKTDTGYRTDLSYKGGNGFTVSFPLTYQFNSYFGLSSAISYIQKNYRIEHYYPSYTVNTPFEYQNVINHYIEIPLTLDCTISRGIFSFTASAGGFIGYWLLSQRYGIALGSSTNLAGTLGKYTSYSGNYSFSNVDKRIEAGLLFRFGFEVEFNPIILFLRSSYSLSLTDMRRSQAINYFPLINNTIIVDAGLLWGFGGKR